jgi:hypothetical protein
VISVAHRMKDVRKLDVPIVATPKIELSVDVTRKSRPFRQARLY